MKALFQLLLALAMAVLTTVAHALPTVTHASLGEYASFFVLSDGSLWGSGINLTGLMGQGFSATRYNSPIQLVNNGVTSVTAGFYATFFIKNDGSLWGMGDNEYGELGDGTTNNHYFPEVILASNVTAVACTDIHTLIQTVHTTGTIQNQTVTVSVLGTGYNHNGQLGIATTNNQSSPVVIDSEEFHFYPAIFGIAASYSDSFFIRPDGTLWGSGGNDYGELGSSNEVSHLSPIQIASDVTAVDANYYSVMFLKSDQSLWTLGNNNGGQLGDNSTAAHTFPEQVEVNVTAISEGVNYSLFIKSDGSLWGMGSTIFPQSFIPVKIVASNVVSVSAGPEACMFIKSDGSLWFLGHSQFNLAGDGFTNTSSVSIPEQIYPTPQPMINFITRASQTNLTIKATCLAGGNYALQTSTNFAQGVGTWLPLMTNSVLNRGSNNCVFNITNAFGVDKMRYYILQKR